MNRRMLVAASLICIVSACAVRQEEELSSAEDETEAESGASAQTGTEASDAARAMVLPQLSDDERDRIVARYAYLDPTRIVPENLRNAAVVVYDFNKSKIPNRDYLSVVDFSKHSSEERFFIIDMKTGRVAKELVAHGSGSDRDDDGFAERFSNAPNSNASSLGYYLTAETYMGKYGRSLRMDGLSTTNSNVRARAIVVHAAPYVDASRKQQGRSWGCFAFSPSVAPEVIDQLRDGSVIYAAQSGVE
jgi:hypothetical protein